MSEQSSRDRARDSLSDTADDGPDVSALGERLQTVVARHGLGPQASAELSALLHEARRAALLPTPMEPDTHSDETDLALAPLLDPELVGTGGRLISLAHPPCFEEGDRYRCLDLIGSGGMGDVFRVWDRELGRVMAMKVLRPDPAIAPSTARRFLAEARVTAQLEHPGIVPIHDIGCLGDGRYYFTMKEVRGRSLTQVIRLVHAARREGYWPPTPDGWTLRRLVDVFYRVCEAVSYAHHRRVIHRDLKPSNVMVGQWGEVLVLDWGLSRTLDHADPASEAAPQDVPRVGRGADTQVGRVIGTPAYMPPEQARGEIDRLGPRADVYALGAMLYQILAGRPPYEGEGAQAILEQVLGGPPAPPGRISWVQPPPARTGRVEEPAAPPRSAPPVPEPLRVLCGWAMARNPERRPAHAGILAEEVQSWLQGEERQRLAMAAVHEADLLAPEIERLLTEADIIEASARAYLARLPRLAPVSEKRQGWAAEDEARALREKAALGEVRYLQTLRAALSHDPELPAAHERLADYYRRRHAEAERGADPRTAAWMEVLLRQHDRIGAHAAYLEGHGTLSLTVAHPRVHATLYRYVETERRMLPERIGPLGDAPLQRVALPRGSYLVELTGPGLMTTRYPVYMDRMEQWSGLPPGAAEPTPLVLPSVGELGPQEIYVPAGWFWSGGDAEAPGSHPRRRVWVDGFIIQETAVTNADYLEFLNDLVAQGRADEALEWAPRERAARAEDRGELLYHQTPGGTFTLAADAEGDRWRPEDAVVMVDWRCARAYAAWKAERTGRPWRLPFELEWEKAARGVDGRIYPWGDFFDPTWALTQAAFADRPRLLPVRSHPTDVSPYGVLGMGGNVCDWCCDAFSDDGPAVDGDGRALTTSFAPEGLRVFRGGSWMHTPRYARIAVRTRYEATGRGGGLGFRLVRPFPA